MALKLVCHAQTQSNLAPYSPTGLRSPGVALTANLTIIRNPADDTEFAEAIEQALAAGLGDPAAVEARLRERYPRALVRPRDLDAESSPTWYVYREGRWVSGG